MAGFMDISGTNLIIKSSNVNENISCANDYTTILTKCQANDGITIKKAISYLPNHIGYTYNVVSDKSITINASSSTITNITTSTTSIPRGVYIVNIKVGVKAATSGTTVNFMSCGLSTSNNAYSTSGTGIFTTMFASLATTAANQNVYGMDCRPVDLSGNSYYLVMNANVNTAVSTILADCAYSCTRIA